MAREDKGSAADSHQDVPSGKSGDQESSLAARRARLRGTLSKQIVPPDPYPGSPGSPTAPSALPSSAPSAPASTISAPAEAIPDHRQAVESRREDSEVTPTLGSKTLELAIGIDSGLYAASSVAAASLADIAEAVRNEPASVSALPAQAPDIVEDKSGASEGTSKKSNGGTNEDTNMVDNASPEDNSSRYSLAELDAIKGKSSDSDAGASNSLSQVVSSVVSPDKQNEVIELLNNLDQQLGICSVNMAMIAKAANEQLEVVRGLAETIQNQAFNEIGLSLSSLSESMSAALEPMKAVGELVPAIDTLVVTLESGAQQSKVEAELPHKLTSDELVMSLADQLSSGNIDPWTFKCAYIAVFPSEHPADLLKKLVDLLGSQRLSGDLFRAAYDAVQAAEPPRPVYTAAARTEGERVNDDAILAQLEELRQANEQLKGRMDQREGEVSQMLAAKDQEVSQTQEMLNSRWEEFSSRYDELTDIVRQRNELLQEKEAELARIQSEKEIELARLQSEKELELGRLGSEMLSKESEISMLRSQLQEMRDHTQEMVADLQRQLTTTKQAVEQASRPEVPRPQTSFFEATAPTPAPVPQPAPVPAPAPAPAPTPAPAPAQALFTAEPARDPFVAEPQQSLPEPVQAAQTSSPISQAASSALSGQSVGGQAIPRPQVAAPTTPFPGTSGSYGSGVRAQVFEVIVRQALAGAPWREICAGPMQVNNISPEEVEGEVKRRQALLKK